MSDPLTPSTEGDRTCAHCGYINLADNCPGCGEPYWSEPPAPAEGLRAAAQAVVDAWDAATDPRVNNRLSIKDYDFLHDEAVAALRAALKEPTDD